MPTIAFIDDRPRDRETLRSLIDVGLRKLNVDSTWDVIDRGPLSALDDYPTWLTEEAVSVLVLDERLREGAEKGDRVVAYDGHQVVDLVRDAFGMLPIFVITAIPDVDDLQARFGRVEEIIDRSAFSRSSQRYVERMVRAGTKYYKEHQHELEELGRLAEKIAIGEATEDNIARAKGLQLSIHYPFAVGETAQRSRWIDEFSERVKRLEELEARIRKHLQENQGNDGLA